MCVVIASIFNLIYMYTYSAYRCINISSGGYYGSTWALISNIFHYTERAYPHEIDPVRDEGRMCHGAGGLHLSQCKEGVSR